MAERVLKVEMQYVCEEDSPPVLYRYFTGESQFVLPNIRPGVVYQSRRRFKQNGEWGEWTPIDRGVYNGIPYTEVYYS